MRRRRLAIPIVGLLLLAAACGEGRTSETAATTAGGRAGPALLQASAGQPAERRQVVYTGELVLRVAAVRKATEAATRVTAEQGGFVFSQNGDKDSSTLTVKVPSDRFDATVAALAGLGTELRRSRKAQDVTAEVVDVEGRLKTAQASADRLRGLLAEARAPGDVVAVEAELTKRETDIETLQGRLRVLQDQVALATLTLRLTERDDLRVARDLPGFFGGLRSGLVAVVNGGQALLVTLGFLIPFVPVAVLLVLAARWYRRRHPRAPRVPPAGPMWPPAPPVAGP